MHDHKKICQYSIYSHNSGRKNNPDNKKKTIKSIAWYIYITLDCNKLNIQCKL